jgi:hypothetical protein
MVLVVCIATTAGSADDLNKTRGHLEPGGESRGLRAALAYARGGIMQQAHLTLSALPGRQPREPFTHSCVTALTTDPGLPTPRPPRTSVVSWVPNCVGGRPNCRASVRADGIDARVPARQVDRRRHRRDGCVGKVAQQQIGADPFSAEFDGPGIASTVGDHEDS